MKLMDVLKVDYIVPALPGSSKTECLEELVRILAAQKVVTSVEKILEAVLQREEIMTTGVGNGIAIPHCKADSIQGFAVALGITREAIDFNAIDGSPVHIIFLLVGPMDQPGMHIKLLSRISRVMNSESIRNQLLSAGSAEEMIELLGAEEDQFVDLH
jgi:fructose-specific phosphotransferase system IIA component